MSLDAALELDGGAKLELVLVPPGEFTMGSRAWPAGSGPDAEHRVRVSKPFYISKYPITVSQFMRFADGANYSTDAEKSSASAGRGALAIRNGIQEYAAGANWRNPGFAQREHHPVVAVSWNDASEFARGLGRKTGRAARLPSEAEWEYARGPQSPQWPWGNVWDGAKCNHADASLRAAGILAAAHVFSDDADGFVYTSPGGQFDNASWCGARDMAGNVWQWCQDWYAKSYYSIAPDTDPGGPKMGDSVDFHFGGVSLAAKVLRGGSFLDSPDMARSSARQGAPAIHRSVNIGFRIVVVPQTKAK